MVDMYNFEIQSKWFGLLSRALKVDESTEQVVWSGRWRIRQSMVSRDIMEKSFWDLLDLFDDGL